MRVVRKITNDADLHQLRLNLEKTHEGFITGDFSDCRLDHDGACRVLMGLDVVVNIAERTPRETSQGAQDLAWFKIRREELAQALNEYETFQEMEHQLARRRELVSGPEAYIPQVRMVESNGKSRVAEHDSERKSLVHRLARRLKIAA